MAGHKREPTPAEWAALPHTTNGEMKRLFGVDRHTTARWRREAGLPAFDNNGKPGAAPPRINRAPEEARATDADWETLYSRTAAHAEAQNDTDEDETHLERDWGDLPIGLLLWSDWHIGSRWCAYQRLREDVEHAAAFQQAHPGALKNAHLGDLIDGYLTGLGKASGGLYESTESQPGRQKGMARWLASQLTDWLVLLLGCHPAWELTNTGDDPISPIARALDSVNGGYGVVLDVTVGTQQYRGLLRHRTRRESSLNTTNAQRALDDDYGIGDGQRFDFISVSHLHNGDLQKRTKAGRRVVFTRSGSAKGGDCFARSIAATNGKGADLSWPLLIFLPDEHRIVAFHGEDWRDGLEYLAALRAKYAARPKLSLVA